MDLSDIISIVITAATRTPDQAGFGIPLIVSHSAAWTERHREYSKLTDLAVDFGSTTPEYLAAARVFQQNPRPPKVFVGRASGAVPTQRWETTPVVLSNYTYKGKLNGLPFSFLSDGTATAAEVTAGLKGVIDALGQAVTTSQQNTNATLRILANVPGAWFDLQMDDPNMPLVQNHADPGLAAELDQILVENKQWYAPITLFNSKAVIDAVAAWAEANQKLYVAQSQDSAVRDTVKSGTDDVGESTQNSAYKHATVWWSKSTSDFLDAALVGAVLPLLPGSETWAFKQLAGVPAGSYTASQRSNLTSKNVGFYEPTAGISVTWEGKTASGQYIDTTRFIDWIQARLAEEVFGALANAKKIPYTAKGIAIIEAAVRRVLKQAANPPIEGITPDYIVVTPRIEDVPSADKASRTLNNVSFSATLTGAIHKLNLQGTISV